MKACIECGAPLAWMYSKRCKSCAAAERWRVRRAEYLDNLAAARAKSHVGRVVKHRPVLDRSSRVRFNRMALLRTLDESNTSISELERRAGMGSGTAYAAIMRRETMPFDTLDRIACALGCHVSEFEIPGGNA